MLTTSLQDTQGLEAPRLPETRSGDLSAASGLFRGKRGKGKPGKGAFASLLDRLGAASRPRNAPQTGAAKANGKTGNEEAGPTAHAEKAHDARKGVGKSGDGYAGSLNKADRDVAANGLEDRKKSAKNPATGTAVDGLDLAAARFQALQAPDKPASRPNERASDAPERDVAAAKKADAKRKTRVEVVDLRVSAEPEKVPGAGPSGDAKAADASGANAAFARAEGGGTPDEATFLGADKPAPGASFSDILSKRLGEQYNGDIVKAAQIVLRDADQGLIRLRLEPETLGAVKIELKMADKEISGRIVVETEEAKSAFERNMAQLRDAFADSGFESTKLDVQVSGGDAGETGRRDDGGDAAPFFSERLRAMDAAVPGIEAAGAARGPRSRVDILA